MKKFTDYYLFTFVYDTQWLSGVYQVIAPNESIARNALKQDSRVTTYHMTLDSSYYIIGASQVNVIMVREWDSPDYDG